MKYLFDRGRALVRILQLERRCERQQEKIKRQAGEITKLLQSKKDLRARVAELGPTKRSAKAKRSRGAMRHMLRAMDMEDYEAFQKARKDVEELTGYKEWLEAQ